MTLTQDAEDRLERVDKRTEEMHALLFGDPKQVEALGLRGLVAKHERTLRSYGRSLLWIASALVALVGAVVGGWIGRVHP